MGTLKTHIVSVAENDKFSHLSKAQKTFNRLIKQIAKKKQELLGWQETIPLYQISYTQEFFPLMEEYRELQENLVYILDEAYRKMPLTQAEKKKVKAIICKIAGTLAVENDNEKLKLIYNKYSGSNLDQEISEDNEMMKSMLEEMLGVEIDDDVDFSSPDEVMRSIGEKLSGIKKEQEENSEKAYQNQRKKSKKALEKEAKEEAEKNHISQSIREVYRKLASALHPDRAQDKADQARKDDLMQRVNVAYGKKDLLQLLELQLEIEQIDQDSINRISEDRLKHYNKILKEQYEDIQREVIETGYFFGMRFNLPPQILEFLSPQNALQYLSRDIKEIKSDIENLEKEISLLKENSQIKSWLKKQNPRPVMQVDHFSEWA